MTYDPKHDALRISTEDARRAACELLYAIRCVRETANLPLEGYECKTALKPPQFAECGIIHAAQALGIDLGGTRPGEIDVRKER